jgi:hypothetical protein
LLATPADETQTLFDHAEIARRLAGPGNDVVAAMAFVEGRDTGAEAVIVQVLTGPPH